MVRYTIALRGPPKDESSSILIHEQEVDIFHQEQMSEQFLCEINPKGQVPVLTSPSLDRPIPDSLDITFYLADFHPSLMPTSHKDQITKLLRDLHALNYFSLTFTGRQDVAQGFKAAIQKLIDGEISDRYREALKYKLGINEREKVGGLKEGVPEEMNERARALMKHFESLLPGGSSEFSSESKAGSWLFGLPNPSALDAHLITFIARMTDVGRKEILPEALVRYADAAMQRSEWNDVMQGRRTVISL